MYVQCCFFSIWINRIIVAGTLSMQNLQSVEQKQQTSHGKKSFNLVIISYKTLPNSVY